ncbi:hypothetical protein ACET3Z_013215 [Daucus carota]
MKRFKFAEFNALGSNLLGLIRCSTGSDLQGLLTLCGMLDAESKPVLKCSINDNSIRVYDLPLGYLFLLLKNKKMGCCLHRKCKLLAAMRKWNLVMDPTYKVFRILTIDDG